MLKRLFRRAALFALTVSIASGVAAAQDAQPTPSHLAAARELLAAAGTDQAMQASAQIMIDQQIAQVPELADFRDVMLEWARKYLSLEYAGDRLAAVYADAFTEGEIRDLTAFYRTPLGAKLALALPTIAEKSAMVGAEIAQQYSGELEKMVTEHAEWLEATSLPDP